MLEKTFTITFFPCLLIVQRINWPYASCRYECAGAVTVYLLLMDRRPPGTTQVSWILLPHILMHMDRHVRLLWIVAFSCLTGSLYLYFCKNGSGSTLRCVGLLRRPPGSTHFTYIMVCIRYSVSATCKLWSCSVHVTSVACLSVLGERSLLCLLFLRFFSPSLESSLLFPSRLRYAGTEVRNPTEFFSKFQRCRMSLHPFAS